MEDIGKRLAALRIQGKAAIEKIPFEILEQIRRLSPTGPNHPSAL